MILPINRQVDEGGRFGFGSMDFGTGAKAVAVTYATHEETRLMQINLDGKPFYKVALNTTGITKDRKRLEVMLPEISGAHEVEVAFGGAAYVESVEFLPELTEEKYVPTKKSPNPVQNSLTCGTDILGRKVNPSGAFRDDKFVGMFYWTWRDNFANNNPRSITQVEQETPEALWDITHPTWKDDDQMHWAEPLYGYYRNSDPYVIRKHTVALAQAGVDALFFDCTNGGFLWFDGTLPLLKGLHEAKEDGINAPKFCFMLNFAPFVSSTNMLYGLYQEIYQKGLYSDLWFCVDGKPVVMGYPEALDIDAISPQDEALLNEMKNFFTFRPGQPLYKGGPTRADQWGWLEMAPQNGYVKKDDGSFEMVTVGVAQNANAERICTHFTDKDTFGRSYTFKDGHKKLSEASYLHNYNLAEQWEYAREMNPAMVFVTGWNEWTSGKWNCAPWITDPDSKQVAFVDQFDVEHSRDIEFDKLYIKDTTYLQFIEDVRKFKSQPYVPEKGEEKTIDISGGFDQWDDVATTYFGNPGNTIWRDYPGIGKNHYKNTSGRNNILEAKVCEDGENLYFYVKAAAPFAGAAEENFMVLLLDTDRNKATGWEGYDFKISGGKAHRYAGGAWQEIGDVRQKVGESQLMLCVPKALLGITAADFEFKWCDNLPLADVMEFYTDGDSAPFGRMNFLYQA